MKNTKIKSSSVILACVLLMTTLALEPTVDAQTAVPRWSYTGNLNTGRSGHTATLLRNGKVLVVGGADTHKPDARLRFNG